MTNQINILITAIGGGGHGEQILKALLGADCSRYVLHGADMNSACPQFGLVHRSWQTPPAASPEFTDAVLDYCTKNEIRAVFHGCEPELLAYSSAREQFAAAGILLPINPRRVIDTCMNKELTAAFLDGIGITPPAHMLVDNLDMTDSVKWFPVVVKPHLGGGGSNDCFLAQDADELRHLLAFLRVGSARTVMVQEYVGTPENEFTVGVLHDLDGRFINSIGLRRELKSGLSVRLRAANRSGRTELGSRLVISSGVSQGEIGKFPEVTETCERIASALEARGPINIQCRLVGKEVKVFEINPRFSGTTSIRAKMGFNEPDLLLRKHLLGESIEARLNYREGLVFRSLTETIVHPASVCAS